MKSGLKISGGDHQGILLKSPPRDLVRPTPARVRKSFFDILGTVIAQGPFLDLYAGSGVMGLEALLRGAPFAVFVDNSPKVLNILNTNISKLGVNDRATIIEGKVSSKLPRLLNNKIFRCIYLDPPYHSDFCKIDLEIMSKMESVNRSLIITETFYKSSLPDSIGYLSITRQERYGDTVTRFWQRNLGE